MGREWPRCCGVTQIVDGLISFFASHHAIRAETVLRRHAYVAKLVPGPRELSPNCGVALRFEYARREAVLGLLAAHRVRIDGIHFYTPRTDEWSSSVAR
jgi:hypothetical protein